MRQTILIPIASLALFASALTLSPTAAMAGDNVWRIAKISGEAWAGASGVQAAALTAEAVLKPGDMIRTGRNGRILLQRGAETMLIMPNSAIGIPAESRAGMSTVLQQAGSILLDVEKANVPHFEVETPYLAAVVKGTQFRVTVTRGQARVDVVRGQVQVADFKSGQYALVLPGQTARVLPHQAPGLKLMGSGVLGAIQQGPAQVPRLQPLAVPREGLRPAAPAGVRPAEGGGGTRAADPAAPRVAKGADGRLQINAPLGEVKLDIQKATQGLARDGGASGQTGQGQQRPTVWGNGLAPGNGDVRAATGNAGASTAGGMGGASSGRSTGNAGITGPSGGAPITTPAAISGNGNNGNANGNANGNGGNSGNGNGNGGNSGNSGSGNSGSGNQDNSDKSGSSGSSGNGNSGSGNGNGRSKSGRS